MKYLPILLLISMGAKAQVLTLDVVINKVRTAHPVVKMYDQEIRSMDEAAKGARAWMPAQLGTGFL